MKKGFTLIEIMVSVGLFALVMTLAAGSYLIMISVNRNVQNISNGIDTLSFALETMTRTIRTSTGYNCNVYPMAGNCASGNPNFYVTDSSGNRVAYARSTSVSDCSTSGYGCITRTTTNGSTGAVTKVTLTDPSVNITSLTFYATGVFGTSGGDYQQPRVTFVISGNVPTAPSAVSTFTVESSATMRGIDL